MLIDGVEVKADETVFSPRELKHYVSVTKSKFPEDRILHLEVKLADDGGVDLNYQKQNAKFERIRRITGYLTGDLNSWNNAKRSEESERVKHGVNDFCKGV